MQEEASKTVSRKYVSACKERGHAFATYWVIHHGNAILLWVPTLRKRMIAQAEKDGKLIRGKSTIIEPSMSA